MAEFFAAEGQEEREACGEGYKRGAPGRLEAQGGRSRSRGRCTWRWSGRRRSWLRCLVERDGWGQGAGGGGGVGGAGEGDGAGKGAACGGEDGGKGVEFAGFDVAGYRRKGEGVVAGHAFEVDGFGTGNGEGSDPVAALRGTEADLEGAACVCGDGSAAGSERSAEIAGDDGGLNRDREGGDVGGDEWEYGDAADGVRAELEVGSVEGEVPVPVPWTNACSVPRRPVEVTTTLPVSRRRPVGLKMTSTWQVPLAGTRPQVVERIWKSGLVLEGVAVAGKLELLVQMKVLGGLATPMGKEPKLKVMGDRLAEASGVSSKRAYSKAFSSGERKPAVHSAGKVGGAATVFGVGRIS